LGRPKQPTAIEDSWCVIVIEVFKKKIEKDLEKGEKG
jgi:hypothetical protein